MSFLDRIRNLILGPPRIQDDSDPGATAALHEEYGTPDEAAADVRRMEETGGGGGYAPERFEATEGAEAAEDELESEEAPPDPSP